MKLEDCREQDVLSVTLTDGSEINGSYLTQAGMHFISTDNPESKLLKKVLGPYSEQDIAQISIIRSRDDILEERNQRLRGERVGGREPITRDDYEYRLQMIARAVAGAGGKRRDQLLRQFDDVADRIALARSKRQWMISEGAWAMKSNEPPTLADLWMADVASPSLLQRPRAQDFDPDPSMRNKRLPLPSAAADDPRSVPNVLSAIRKAGLKVVISLAGDPAWERAVLQVDLGPGRTRRFLCNGKRGSCGLIEWTLTWGGNHSAPGLRARRQAVKLHEYKLLRAIIAQTNEGNERARPAGEIL